jgi:hypothetical protein
MKYEIPITYHSKYMANVKVFADTHRQTDRQTGQKLYAPIFRYGGITIEPSLTCLCFVLNAL